MTSSANEASPLVKGHPRGRFVLLTSAMASEKALYIVGLSMVKESREKRNTCRPPVNEKDEHRRSSMVSDALVAMTDKEQEKVDSTKGQDGRRPGNDAEGVEEVILPEGEEVVGEGKEDRVEKSEARKSGDESAGHPWQAVYDATLHAWYFWNSETQETTWTNPLERVVDSGESSQSAQATNASKDVKLTDEEVATAHGIDTDLAYLDPTLYASEVRQARTGSSTYSASGVFDSRTGKFVPLSARATHDPSRLSHANQADRQMGAFFDVQQYEEERKRDRDEQEEEEAQDSKRKKAPTKKELQRYKQRAKEKKAAKYGWLRE
ncbi:hypothetical protein CBS101457_006683 [Exobasidium rhododendri]|nr:hypothetical protein CBS101457_006683 [Exobasidium rhododendri]